LDGKPLKPNFVLQITECYIELMLEFGVTNLSCWLADLCHKMFFRDNDGVNLEIAMLFVRADGMKEFVESFLAPDACSKLLLEEQQFGHTEYPRLYDSVRPKDYAQGIAAKLIKKMCYARMNDQQLIEFWNRFFATGPICGLVVGWLRSENWWLSHVSESVWLMFRPVLAGNRHDPVVGNIRQRLIQLNFKEALTDAVVRIEAKHNDHYKIRPFREIIDHLN